MKALHFILPTALVASAAIFFGTTQVQAFSFDGNNLSVFERDFRIFSNFTDATANNNTTPHVNYPGATGAVMALWKGAVEWNSQAIGNGTGDPTQASIGSGNANFDAYFAKQATSAGVMGQNIMSELAGSSGGVLAFTEIPGSPGGWRILFYSVWDWQDGPGAISGGGNAFDLQSINCHEYGHALGLGHSAVPGATMEPSAAAQTVTLRSIEADDIAGVQALYGVKSVTKPTITGLTGSGAPLRLTGTNFAATNNEVWFTPLNPTAATAVLPIKVGFLPSSAGGTIINVNVPASAGKGVVMMRNTAISTGAGLSNSIPYDPTICPTPVEYCVGKLNSFGNVPSIGFTGSNSASIGGLAIQVSGAVPNKAGLFLFSENGSAATPYFGGTLCLNAPVERGPYVSTDFTGFAEQPVTINPPDIGIVRWYQYFYRDNNSPDGIRIGLSNAIQVTFCP